MPKSAWNAIVRYENRISDSSDRKTTELIINASARRIVHPPSLAYALKTSIIEF